MFIGLAALALILWMLALLVGGAALVVGGAVGLAVASARRHEGGRSPRGLRRACSVIVICGAVLLALDVVILLGYVLRSAPSA